MEAQCVRAFPLCNYIAHCTPFNFLKAWFPPIVQPRFLVTALDLVLPLKSERDLKAKIQGMLFSIIKILKNITKKGDVMECIFSRGERVKNIQVKAQLYLAKM